MFRPYESEVFLALGDNPNVFSWASALLHFKAAKHFSVAKKFIKLAKCPNFASSAVECTKPGSSTASVMRDFFSKIRFLGPQTEWSLATNCEQYNHFFSGE